MDAMPLQHPDPELEMDPEDKAKMKGKGEPPHELRTLSNVAKFKAIQDLRIQTVDLPDVRTSRQARSTRSSRLPTPGTDSASSTQATPKTPATSTGKKRRRRTAAQIDRRFPCTYPGCTKAYGSEGSLTQHQRLKHRNQVLDPRHNHANNQVGNLLLPLHRAPRSTPGGSTSYRSGVPLPHLRPANVLDGTILPLQFEVPSAALDPDELLMATDMAATPHGQQLRARSNSMPISFSGSNNLLQYPLAITEEGPRRARKSRPGSTPRPRSLRSFRRAAKSRSNSESFTVLEENDGNGQMLSDRTMSEPLMFHPTGEMEWGVLDSTHSPLSESDEAIDSDILSVLADYDSSDEGDSPAEFAGPDSFLVANLATSIEPTPVIDTLTSAEHALTSPSTTLDEWASNPDTMFLSSHLEKMSMAQKVEHEHMEDTTMIDSSHMHSVPDRLANVPVVSPPSSPSFNPIEPDKAPHSVPTMLTSLPPHDLWEKTDLTDPEFMVDTDLDAEMFLLPDASLDPATTWKSEKLYGAFPLLDDSFLSESSPTIGVDESRLSSPVLRPMSP